MPLDWEGIPFCPSVSDAAPGTTSADWPEYFIMGTIGLDNLLSSMASVQQGVEQEEEDRDTHEPQENCSLHGYMSVQIELPLLSIYTARGDNFISWEKE